MTPPKHAPLETGAGLPAPSGAARPGPGWPTVTMADVAREAQVSTATVSRILDGVVPVAEATRAKVLDAIARTGYIRNEAATRLARGSSDTVGLLLRDPSNPYYGRLHAELQLRTAQHRMQLLTVASPPVHVAPNESSGLRRLLEHRVGGILVATGLIDPHVLLPFVASIPTVVLGRPEDHPSLHTVAHDEQANGYLIADQVLAHDHADVAVVVPVYHPDLLVEHRRGTFTAERLRAGGANVTTIDVPPPRSSDPDMVNAAVIDLVRRRKVTAVMFPADMRLLAFLSAAQQAQLRIPDDVSATGVDGVLTGIELLGLATVRLPIETLARRGLEIISAQMSANGPIEIRHESLTGTFMPGRTLALRS